MHGFGVETWENGPVYNGFFTNGLKGPKGVFKDKDGDVYEGEFSDGMINGKGKLINAT